MNKKLKQQLVHILKLLLNPRAGFHRVVLFLKKRQLILLTIVVVILGFVSFFEYTYQDRFYPGVSIGNISVGGKTYTEVTTLLGDRAKVLTDTGLHLKFLDGGTTKEIIIPISAPGFNPDKSFEYFSLGEWGKTVDEAYQYGRTGSYWQRTKEHVHLVRGTRFLLPSTLYEVAVDSFLSRELELFLKKAEPARFAIDRNGEVYITPEKIGERMDTKEVIIILKKKLAYFDSSPKDFKAEVRTPLSTQEDLQPFLHFAQELSQKKKMVFHYKTYSWNVSGAKLVTWLTIDANKQIGLDQEKLRVFLSQTVSSVINDAPESSRFKIYDDVLTELTPGHAGTVVDVVATAQKATDAIAGLQILTTLSPSNTDATHKEGATPIDITIEITREEPKVTNETIGQYNIRDLVGFSKTSFRGSSADRIKNIKVGAEKLNGRLIAPGEEFSAVDAIGYVTEEAGYVKEFVIKDNKSVKELGGGLCQIATTLFRLALNAGLPITERVSHRYVVGYYGPGLDATIYGPHPDLRFVNDTGHYLLLQSRVSGTDLIFELYGKNDGREVRISEPILSNRIPAPSTKYVSTTDLPLYAEKCSETPRGGVTADVTYRVALPNGGIREQIFNSVYQPWQKVCLVGTPR
ncbi:MAG: hypothetical protein A2937_02125 [Candidatus Yonathbacteria bacterium RIFCSPLOWO2_01_FULL_47_33b]|uniref:YoaR-like putative peptidoglycan binding domain-containing protein n=1 Tax=Candidatus Yonathbacteria bacterium RIFCSPLOWO2_01_FULL_47_33b TaxID=1802727 RepID=A0A1G2SIS7_9BACT|nr:MAG: hypothetical protein A2937_02125 [Candidatus Yonathbacteria bacterium RIFCSPLOWO2_01_FULL_47_33b]